MLHRLLARQLGDSDPESGFSLIEMVIAVTIIFGALLVLITTTLVGLSDAALARQRHTANAIANKVLEQIRALPYEKIGQGLKTSNLASDPNIVQCPDGKYYFSPCGPSAEEIVHTAGLSNITPLVPSTGSAGPPTYPNTYTWRAYVTRALGVPTAGAYRVTTIVSWNPTVRRGAALPVRAQTLLYKPEGSTDPTTGAGTFFYGTSDLVRGSMKLTPNAGVSGGTGVTGLSAWDSISQDLTGIGTDLTTQALSRADGQVTLDGAIKAIGGVDTETGGTSSTAKADDDPVTSFTTSSAPTPVTATSTEVSISGGGNRVSAGGSPPTGGGGSCSAGYLGATIAGFETGHIGLSSTGGYVAGIQGGVTVDPAVKRTGAYSMKVVKPSQPAPSLHYISFGGVFLNQYNVSSASFGLYLDTLPSSDVLSLMFYPVGGNALNLGYQASTQKLTLRWGSGTPIVSGPVSAGTWYQIDLKQDVNVNPRTASWRVNGVDQGTVTSAQAAANSSYIQFGSGIDTDAFTAHFDDIAVTASTAQYPIGEMNIRGLKPNGMGTHSPASPTALQNNDNSAINAATYTRLDDVPMNSIGDFVKQVTQATTSYVELTFEDTTEVCIQAVRGIIALHSATTSSNNSQAYLYDGATQKPLWNGSHGNTTGILKTNPVAPNVAPWSQATLNGMKARIGYSSDVNPVPYFDALMIEYAVAAGGAGGGGPPSDQSGYGKATVPPSSPATCYSGQTAGACGYSQAAYPANPPTRQTLINLAGSGGGDCFLYKYTPDVATSFAYGRRDTTLNPTGSIVGDISHRYGVHEIGGLCASTVAAPAGWPGYLVKYDPGGSTSTVKAAAGIAATWPRFAGGGIIYYWNGTGVSTMAPPAAGGSIPVSNFVGYISNGWRYDIDVALATLPSSVSQVPANAPMSGTADRTEAKAVLGAPIAGKITYKLTNTGTGNVIVDLTIDVDLGSLTASSVYTP